jgi:hypothetical protein
MFFDRRHEGLVTITSTPLKPNELRLHDVLNQSLDMNSNNKPIIKMIGDDWIETTYKHKFNEDGSLTQKIIEKTIKPNGKKIYKIKEITYFK